MSEALLIVALLGLAWALVHGLVFAQRFRALERVVHQERAAVAERLETLEGLARDRWLAEAATLGDQVTAMIEALEATASQSTQRAAEQASQLAALIQRADETRTRLTSIIEQAGAPTAEPRPAPRRAPTPLPGGARRPVTGETTLAPTPPQVARQREVRRLAAEGLVTAEIARRTGLGVAEIDLILRLARPEPLQRLA